MEWAQFVREVLALLLMVLAAAAFAGAAWFSFKRAQWTRDRERVTARDELTDATRDATAEVQRVYVDPLKRPDTPGTFDDDAQKHARDMAATLVAAAAPRAVRVLKRAGIPVQQVVRQKIDRAVLERKPAAPPEAQS